MLSLSVCALAWVLKADPSPLDGPRQSQSPSPLASTLKCLQICYLPVWESQSRSFGLIRIRSHAISLFLLWDSCLNRLCLHGAMSGVKDAWNIRLLMSQSRTAMPRRCWAQRRSLLMEDFTLDAVLGIRMLGAEKQGLVPELPVMGR
jgi:hypothetical protein